MALNPVVLSAMAPVKSVIKCGNFAVLVDLHVVPLGGQQDASWFTAEHVEEAAALLRPALDRRVQQLAQTLHSRRQPRPRKEKEPPPAAAFTVTGKNFNLVANFLKRHFTLRCASSRLHGDLRVFAERCVVCVSCPEDASAPRGNPSLAATEPSEQSTSEYFSRVGETEPANSNSKTKTALQKLAKHAAVRRQQRDQRGGLSAGGSGPEETPSLPDAALKEPEDQTAAPPEHGGISPTAIDPDGASGGQDISEEPRKKKRCEAGDAGEDPPPPQGQEDAPRPTSSRSADPLRRA